MRAAILDSNNVVINVAQASSEFSESQGWIVSDTARIGDVYDPEAGSFTPPPSPAPQVPESVPALEALLALDAAGLSDAYEAWATDPARTFAERAFINKALTWRRDDPTLQAAAEALELSSKQVDQLFIDADARTSE